MNATMQRITGSNALEDGALDGWCLKAPEVGERFVFIVSGDDRYIRTSEVKDVVGPAEGLVAKRGVFHVFTKTGSHYRVVVSQ